MRKISRKAREAAKVRRMRVQDERQEEIRRADAWLSVPAYRGIIDVEQRYLAEGAVRL
jgi:hypothetical protein